jgi:galactokinase
MPLSEEQKVQLAELLGEAEQGDLPTGFVTQSTLQGRLSDKDKARQALEAKHAEEKAALEAAHAESAKTLKQLQREAMSAEEKRAADLAEQEARFAASETARATAAAEAAAASQLATDTWLDNQLANVFASSASPPANLATAVREAKAELGIGATLTEGKFSLSLTAEGQPVDKPGDALGAWYEKRSDLHGKAGGILPLRGGGHPRPGEPPPVDPLEGKSPIEQLKYATGVTSSTA